MALEKEIFPQLDFSATERAYLEHAIVTMSMFYLCQSQNFIS